jgi:Fic family protein
VAADLADAERALVELNHRGNGLVDTESLARLLLRTESVASSRIEGLEIGGRRLFKAQLATDLGLEPADRGAAEVLNNIEVMRGLIEQATASPLTVAMLLDSHERLLRGTRFADVAGRFRDVQNWIGGSEMSPCSAEFVPPPPQEVPWLMEDFSRFCSRDDLPALAQAAIAHAQFETIHPFFDGNGRIGRAIIHAVLRRRGITPRFVPPVSLVLATRSRDYVRGLTATRYRGRAGSPAAKEGLGIWLGTFAAATIRSIEDAQTFDSEVRSIQARWRERLGRTRSDSSTALLIDVLPAAPVLTVKTATDLIGRSGQSVNQAVGRLTEAGILVQTTVGRRNRAFEAPDLIAAFNALERQLASPAGNTRTDPPTRPVPAAR